MSEPLLDFRTLLKILARLYDAGEFDTGTVAEDLVWYFSREIKDSKTQLELLQRVRPKLISNDLRRLYTMGFLKRRRVPRKCKNGKGKEYNCGFKYMYRINNQGWGYLTHLQENELDNSLLSLVTGELKETLRGITYGMNKLAMVTAFERGEVGKAFSLWDFYRKELRKRFSSPGFRRFTRKKELFERDTNCWMKMMYLGMQISSLENEIRARDVMIGELRKELEACLTHRRPPRTSWRKTRPSPMCPSRSRSRSGMPARRSAKCSNSPMNRSCRLIASWTTR